MTTTKRLSELAETVRLEATYGAKLPWEKQTDWQQRANGYRCTLRYQGRRFSFDFWQGQGITHDPTAAGVLECLLSDAQAEGQTFEEWCSDLGEDPDSRRALATFEACRKIGEGLRRLLGDDFDTFLYADRD